MKARAVVMGECKLFSSVIIFLFWILTFLNPFIILLSEQAHILCAFVPRADMLQVLRMMGGWINEWPAGRMVCCVGV